MKFTPKPAAILASAGALLFSAFIAAQAPFGFAERMQRALAEPYVGLIAGDAKVEGLFPMARTGVPTTTVREAAERLIEALSAEQRARALYPVDDSEWRNWANVHRFPRQGVALDEMTTEQRDAVYGLLRAGLSARGYETSRDIMRLNHSLAELVANFDEYGEHLYFVTIMGLPSATDPWGWQLDGHHLVINYFVLGDQVVMTPTFMGSEPVAATSGRYTGTAILEDEQALAVAFMRSLDDGQRAAAVLGAKGRGENVAEMMRDNVTIPYQGLPVTRLDAEQRKGLLDLIALYVGNMDSGHAAVKMDEVMAHLDETYFGWKGSMEADGVFYYRIHNPVLYIEFDHQGPTALSGPRDVATRNHIHSVVRTPNGNDYGKDLLRQHYAAYADDPAHGHAPASPARAR
jgi:Protein of unknown function (DUF3500)